MVYVDDFKLSGPKGNLAKGWALIRENLVLERPSELDSCLGRVHRLFELALKDGTKVRAMEYDMESYLHAAANRYCDLAMEIIGMPVRLKVRMLPSL